MAIPVNRKFLEFQVITAHDELIISNCGPYRESLCRFGVSRRNLS
jgi:hypothetical protein